jgi:catechol 2,3-dioxygenase-like lactoylglutathione lyase family enzyme
MDAAVTFYRDLLGLRVVRTNPSRLLENGIELGCQYFFALGNEELFSFYEVKDAALPNESIIPGLWPEPGQPLPGPVPPSKLDHLAFDVPTRADLVWFREYLDRNGVTVSEVVERKTGPSHPTGTKFVTSIYFFDPDGNAVEIATLDRDDPEWQGYDYTEWFTDDDPAPSLLRPYGNA